MATSPDGLVAVLELCVSTLAPHAEADRSQPADSTDWSCRETLEHLCSLAFAHQLATRATGFRSVALTVAPRASVEELLWTLEVLIQVLAEAGRAAPAEARAFHPAGVADRRGWMAMGMDELLVRTADIAAGLGMAFAPPAALVRPVLDRLFPWWAADADPWAALLWADGRRDLAGRPNLGETWAWHAAPLEEWDGRIARWDPVRHRPAPSTPI